MHFLYYRFLFHIKTWTLFSDWVHIFLIKFFLGLQLQLQICLLGVGKMNDFMMFVTECTKENQNWALGREFIIETLKRWGKPKICMKVTVFRLSGVVGIQFWTSIVRSEAPWVLLFLSLTDSDFTNVGNFFLWYGGQINLLGSLPALLSSQIVTVQKD